uniref:Neur_chan_LBD domain-containing protein n=1 Tax=Panagrellus redivivus TaxID=6233 RepID=A0A7E4UZH7_PANRE
MWLPCVVFGAITALARAGDHEKHLYDRLQHGYNKLARPVRNESNAVDVGLGMDLQQIIDVDEKSQTITTNVWLRFSWNDIYLSWDPEEYGGIQEVRLPIDYIWKPDVLLYNSVEQQFNTMWPVNAIVDKNGNVTWIPPAITRSSCRISITWFPFDTQICKMKFGSWSYSSFFTNLFNKTVSLDPYTPNGEWILLRAESTRNAMYYDCCPDEPYVDVTFIIEIRRRTLYYGFNLVIPSVTILVSLSIFHVMVAETMPQTADSLPLIAVYFTCVMFEVSASVVCTVIVLNFHHRNGEAYYPMSNLQRRVLLEWLPWLLCMRRPPQIKIPNSYDHTTALAKPRRRSRGRSYGADSDMLLDFDSRILAHPEVFGSCNGHVMQGKTSKHSSFAELHLDNCKEHRHRPREVILYSGSNPERLASLGTQLGGAPGIHEDLLKFDTSPTQKSPNHRNHANSIPNRARLSSISSPIKTHFITPTTTIQSAFSEDQYEGLMSQLRFLTAKSQKDEILSEVHSEWMYAGMVVDRICFITFTFFLALCTVTIIWHAPHLIA